jgi:glycosyltransferase involved in cell wall biosynthesis
MKTFIFIRNKKYRPSTYYRLYQYIQYQKADNYKLIEYELDSFYKNKTKNKLLNFLNSVIFSLLPGYSKRIISIFKILLEKKDYNIFVQREFFPKFIGPTGKYLLKKLIRRANKVIWDFDDNIFESREITKYEQKLLMKFSSKILVGNSFLFSKLDPENQKKAIIVNTTDSMMENINLNELLCERTKIYNKELVLIWVGTKGNLQYLSNIIKHLELAASKLKKTLTLKIISDGIINTKTRHLKILNIKWDRDVAIQEMLNAHVGLMPLVESEFTKGKCAFKAVQAIGLGLPVVVSDVGMNKEVTHNDNGILIKNDSDWTQAIIELGTDIEKWEKKSIRSRDLWLTKYNSVEIKKILKKILEQ